MHSPGSRRWLERGCRAVALAALGVLLWHTWRPGEPANAPMAVAATGELPGALAHAVQVPLALLDVTLDSLPGPRERDWMRAVSAAGTSVRWRMVEGDDSAAVDGARGSRWATSVTAEPLPDPAGRIRVLVHGPPGASVSIADDAGSIDSATLSASGARLLDVTADGVVSARFPGSVARTTRRDSLLLRPVLVLANAGWEGKFVVAALEEAGWRVDARFSVAPQADVRQGGGTIDTARYAAVIALDGSAASQGAAIARFVRSGGGAVIAPSAAALPALAGILPARPGAPVEGTLGALAGEDPRRGLGGIALGALVPSAVAVERRGGAVRIAAARAEVGRVLLLGYDETWRWRMEGGEGAPAAHRAWWAGIVASVARAPLVQLVEKPEVDEAPYAALRSALGAPSGSVAAAAGQLGTGARDALLLALLLGGLLAEWASRRLRGVR